MSVSLSRGWFVITHAIDWKNCNEIVGGGVLQEPAVTCCRKTTQHRLRCIQRSVWTNNGLSMTD